MLHDRFGANLGDLEFDEIRDQFVRADYTNDGGTRHDLYSAGAGFVQVTQLLAFILGKQAGIVLLDEPDAHLHSSLQRVVVEVLDDISRREGFQVILATHSKEIINDFVDPTRLILVESGSDHAAPVSDEVTPMAIMRSLGAIDNVDAYALVKNRRCLFVEGSGDVSILGRFAATLGIRALTGDDRVVTVPVGGADRFEHVERLDVFEAMLGNPVGSLGSFVMRTQMTDELEKATQEAARPLLIWERDSIESYLIEATVIQRVISEIATERALTVALNVDDVARIIDESCDELKTAAQDRLGQRYTEDVWRHEAERVTVPQANEAARAMLESNWATLEGRLRVVSGKQILGVIRREVQNEFGVNFGNERLAEAFVSEEVPTEISDALHQVVELRMPDAGAPPAA